jgi:hypothetical protein
MHGAAKSSNTIITEFESDMLYQDRWNTPSVLFFVKAEKNPLRKQEVLQIDQSQRI